MNKDYKEMSDDEIWEEIEKKYGKNWDPKNFEDDDPLKNEWLDRVAIAY